MAGLAEGIWSTTAELAQAWRLDAAFEPTIDRTLSRGGHDGWLRAVERSRHWVASED